MKVKGFNKLILQIILFAGFTILMSTFTDSEIWLKYFNTYHPEGNKCYHGMIYCIGKHYHWNYRGIVYIITCVIVGIITIIRIALSHKEEDFK